MPARSQLLSLQQWLGRHPPSRVARSQGVGWIAVKLRDKGRKVVEAKVAWEERGAGGSMAVVDGLAQEFQVLGGKWMCHLPTDRVDAVWSRVAVTLLSGGLGSPVYMVKVSPLEDVNLEQADGEHVLIVYNTDYRDTEQVMRVENLLRSAGVTSALNYKPDVFSALGIYRNNRWGLRPTTYRSTCLEAEGRSRVETVATGQWCYNSSKGIQRPEDQGVPGGEGGRRAGARKQVQGPVKRVRKVQEAPRGEELKAPGKGEKLRPLTYSSRSAQPPVLL